jgi:hypothetical protein
MEESKELKGVKGVKTLLLKDSDTLHQCCL